MANVLIGKVLKAQGIKGEVKVKAYTNDLDRFLRYSYFIVDGKKIKVVKIRKDKDFAYVLFDNVLDMNTAETFRNKDLYVDSKDLPKLDDDTFYLCDLIGSKILSEKNEELGVIKNINDDTKNAVILAIINGKTASFPLISKIIKSFDREKKEFAVYSDLLNEVLLFED